MNEPSRFQLAFDGRAYTLAINGVDLSSYVSALDLHIVPHAPPSVVLHLNPTQIWPADVDLPAQVHVGVPPEPGPAAAVFLEALDPVEVERAALARFDLESIPGGGTAAVLRQLAEWARGH